MMKVKSILLAGALVSVSGAVHAQMAEADGPTRKIANQYICQFDASVTQGSVDAETGKAVGRSLGQVLHTYKSTIRGFAVRMPAMPDRSPIAELRANNSKVAACEQDQEVKAFGKPVPSPPPEATELWGMTRVGGSGSPVSGRVAWVIDTGIDLDHPELNVQVSRSRSFVNDSSPDDANGHGTHVAGTIGARKNNGIGVFGVAPNAPVVSVRVLDRSGRGSTSGVIAGVDYVANNASAGDVANMSLGGGPSTALDNAVKNAAARGIRFTLAAGNEGDNANNHSPARANGTGIYTVSAIDFSDTMASWSNYGSSVDFAEPGVSIRSTYKNGGYATLSGTSMAAPHLAGILMAGGVKGSGTAKADPDGNPDPIGVRQ